MDVEWLILADAAQVANGKLNLLGGGWDILTVNDQFPHKQHLAVAASFRVPWNETNQPQGIQIVIIEDDTNRELLKVDGHLEVGRPPGILRGQDQRAQIAVEGITELSEGTYRIIARAESGEEKQTSFRVVPGPELVRRAAQG